MRCLCFANTEKGFHIAPRPIGKPNGDAHMPPLYATESHYLRDASGLEKTTLALAGKQIKRRMAKQHNKRPDFRQECNQPKVYRCLHAFMGSFNQQDCYAFILDPYNDKCIFLEHSGECNRGDGLE